MSEYSPQRFQMLPTAVKNLLIINVIFFMATIVLERQEMFNITNALILYPIQSGYFKIWQPVTYMFMHSNFDHLFFNMFALWMFGYVLENIWGTRRFLFYYFACGLGAAAISLLIGHGPTLGASGAVYGILLAFGMLFPEERIYLYFLLPIKAKWFIIGYAALELFEGVIRSYDGIAHFAHLGGMLIGLIIILLWRRKERDQYNGPFRY